MVKELMKELDRLKDVVKQKEAAVEKWQQEAEAAGEIASNAARVSGERQKPLTNPKI